MLVEVPITVIMPPRIAAKDKGISNADTDPPVRFDHRETAGTSIATIGVLLKKADAPAAGPSSFANVRLSPPLPPRREFTTGTSTPVLSMAPART